MTFKSETATVRERRKRRCMQTAKEMHVKMTFRKVTKCYSGRRDNKLSTPFKQVPFTVVQKNGNSVLVEADGVQYRRNVTHVKRYLEPEDLKPKAESSDATGGGDLVANPESQALKVPADTSNRPSEEGNPPECQQADPTLAQSDSTPSLCPFRVRKVSSRYRS